MRKISISTDHIPTGRRLKRTSSTIQLCLLLLQPSCLLCFLLQLFERISILLDLRLDTCDLCLFTADHLLSLRLLLYELTLQRIQIFIFFLKLCLFVLYSFHRILKLNQHIPVIRRQLCHILGFIQQICDRTARHHHFQKLCITAFIKITDPLFHAVVLIIFRNLSLNQFIFRIGDFILLGGQMLLRLIHFLNDLIQFLRQRLLFFFCFLFIRFKLICFFLSFIDRNRTGLRCRSDTKDERQQNSCNFPHPAFHRLPPILSDACVL